MAFTSMPLQESPPFRSASSTAMSICSTSSPSSSYCPSSSSEKESGSMPCDWRREWYDAASSESEASSSWTSRSLSARPSA
uniref:Uncharacterized protein n=1 Tax=Arundo donax TaxID=35708 RepID=A0A0A9G0Y5_ARUDO